MKNKPQYTLSSTGATVYVFIYKVDTYTGTVFLDHLTIHEE